jgi:hypothetical protein
MPRHTCSCHLADIGADVEPLRTVHLAQEADAVRHQFHHLGARQPVQVFERGLVGIRHHHEVSARVGEAVQDDESMVAAGDDQVAGPIGLFGEFAKDAAVVAVRFDVLHAPGGEDAFHVRIVAKNSLINHRWFDEQRKMLFIPHQCSSLLSVVNFPNWRKRLIRRFHRLRRLVFKNLPNLRHLRMPLFLGVA